MHVVIDIECNSLNSPTKVWLVCCKCVDTGELRIFRRLPDEPEQADQREDSLEAFKAFASNITCWIGHNLIEYDLPVLYQLVDLPRVPIEHVVDTLIISRLVDYSRSGGHSIAQYGEEFGLPKAKFSDWTQYSQEMEDYCVRDVEICSRVYDKYRRTIESPEWQSAISLEQRFQLIVNDLHNNGFAFDVPRATNLLSRVQNDLQVLDDKILEAFPPREVLIRVFTPKATKFGTINKASVPRVLHERIHDYEIGKSYRHTKMEAFNPSSHKQLIEVLNAAGWRPEDKTQTHIDTERALSTAKRGRRSEVDAETLESLHTKLSVLQRSGWKINEQNLGTLPKDAPEGSRLLAQRILLEARRRTLTEWLGLVDEDNRVRGKFVGLGAWTHRMAHQKPNTANIPREFKEDGSIKLLGRELRSLWIAPKKRLLVGVDAEGIQLRIFAHYIQDEEFTDALVKGRKDDKTDPHSLNQRVLGSVCKTRQAAKRFVYALLLGGGLGKLAIILGCNVSEAKKALDRLLERYTGFARIKNTDIPKDAKKGYFIGLDGRCTPLPGETQRDREHLCMSGYLQNGEAIIIKKSAVYIDDALHEEKDLKKWLFCDIVHDEYVMEIRNDMGLANRVKKIACDAIEEAGKFYNLKCPLKGDGDVGLTWATIH